MSSRKYMGAIRMLTSGYPLPGSSGARCKLAPLAVGSGSTHSERGHVHPLPEVYMFSLSLCVPGAVSIRYTKDIEYLHIEGNTDITGTVISGGCPRYQ